MARAADLIDQESEAILMRSEFATFFRWMDALPDDLVRQHPSLCLYHALALLWSGQPVSAIEARMGDIDAGSDLVASQVDALRASLAIWQGRTSRASGLAKAALDQLPGQDSLLRGVAAWTLGLAHMLGGEIEAGTRVFEQVASTARQKGNVMLAVTAMSHIAEQQMSRGQLCEAQQIYQQALDLAIDAQGQRLPIAGMPLIGLGEIEREWNDLDGAERYILEGIERVQEWAAFGSLDGHIALARVKQARRDADGAQQSMQAARQIATEFDITELDDRLVELHQIHLWTLQGNLDAVRQWLEERDLLPVAKERHAAEGRASGEEPAEYLEGRMRSYERLLLAKYLLVEGRAREALPLLETEIERERVERGGRSRRLIGTLAQAALAYQSLGKNDRALEYLGEALGMAERGRFVRLFLDEGEPMTSLLRMAASRGIRPAYAASLLAAQEPSATGEDGTARPAGSGPWTTQPLIEPLTKRELDVLRLLAAGLSNPEIAEELFVATSTVRSHLKSIYGKLDVHRRWDAVHRAQELGLV
jgi:LuxR family maltose regulon positive regulatory protein